MIQRGCLYVHVTHRNKEAREENSKERPIIHSNREVRQKQNKADGIPTYMSTRRNQEWFRCDTYMTIVNPPPFPPPAIGAGIMLELLSAMLSILLRFHIAPPALIRVGMPPEVKMPGIS